MTDRIKAGQLYPHLLPPGHLQRNAPQQPASGADKPFKQLLENELIKFSRHAELRLEQRGIRLAPEQMSKLKTAVDKAAAKGAKESLVLFPDLALIVNVKNRTVVTAVDGGQMKDSVFTQIDSAVIIS